MKEFEQARYNATIYELSDNLFGMMNAVDMLDKTRIRSDVCITAISYLMFLKRMIIGAIKARGCNDGRTQREFMSKEESSSPTLSTYALFISCVIDAMEGKQVATCDIPRAVLQTDCPKDNDCYLKLEGLMVYKIPKINPSYVKYMSFPTKSVARRNCMRGSA